MRKLIYYYKNNNEFAIIDADNPDNGPYWYYYPSDIVGESNILNKIRNVQNAIKFDSVEWIELLKEERLMRLFIKSLFLREYK